MGEIEANSYDQLGVCVCELREELKKSDGLFL